MPKQLTLKEKYELSAFMLERAYMYISLALNLDDNQRTKVLQEVKSDLESVNDKLLLTFYEIK